MGYVEDHALMFTTDNDLHKKMGQSLIASARYIQIEDPGTANHPARLQWADYVLGDPGRSDDEAHRGMSWFLSDEALAAAGNTAEDSLCDAVAAANIDNLAEGGYV